MAIYDNTARNKQALDDLDNEIKELEAQRSGKPVETPETEEKVVETEEDKTWKERYSNLQSYHAKQLNEAKAREKDLEKRLTLLEKKPTDSEVPSTVDEARQWVKKYPELSGILKALMKEEANFVKEELSSKLDELDRTKREVDASRAFQAVVRVHPDFGELVNSRTFGEWLERQPEEKGRAGQAMVDVMTNGFDADEAIKVVNIYKRELSPGKKKDPVRAAAETVSRSTPSDVPENVSGKRQWKESEIDKMSFRDFDRFEADIDAAKREGRFVYDITGAAR